MCLGSEERAGPPGRRRRVAAAAAAAAAGQVGQDTLDMMDKEWEKEHVKFCKRVASAVAKSGLGKKSSQHAVVLDNALLQLAQSSLEVAAVLW